MYISLSNILFPIRSLPDKLIPVSAACIDSRAFEDSERFIKLITDLGRTLLTEIAHQSLPPSGIPLLVPKLIHERAWQTSPESFMLPIEVSLNEYEQTFSYMRWYRYEEQFHVLNSSCALHDEVKDIATTS
ncbi:PREDICTED: uncharacterized protein LOC105556244 [Vollenhovia emeryi]|uniref:uncharacterized protein LOC105556244 n=1 Tax=Vollenhovia emeryi TaxID=411798 RepID=UPI0005F416DF|nr:PREDICTED: uncharacterized protein LOC105556244 [Vollenhovia emeryi]